MPSGGVETPIPESMFARLASATRYVISGAGPASWFGPQQPLAPQAPPEVKGRQWDYPFGVNINYTPRSEAALSFDNLRSLADALPLLRAVIETRKDQIAALNWTVRARDPRNAVSAAARCNSARAFFVTPDRRHDFATWLRILIEDMLVIDAACVYPRYTRSGALYSLDVIDGANIKPLIAEDGRSPEPPDAAYQQVLHGVPAADFSADELLYLPRNVRSHRLYGLSPVEQIALTINIALRREQATLEYYNTGSIPDSFATLPKDWTVDQIRQFQDYFDALMSGNLARRRMVKFMPADFKLTETRQSPLKDQYDEWLARVICYAFSVPASAFIAQVNRATSETLRTQAAQEGLVPLKAWVKRTLDRVVQACLKQPDLEFAWVGDDAVDSLQQAQTIAILVNAGVKTRDEARADLGLAGAKGVAKFNPNHDELGRFTWANNPGGAADNQVADNGDHSQTMTDAGGGGRPSGTVVAATNTPDASLGVAKYAVRLAEEEKHWGGHGVKDHVAVSESALKQELADAAITTTTPGGTETIYRVSGEGSFDSLESANDFANRILESRHTEVDKVASGEWQDTFLNQRFGYRTGYEAAVLAKGGIVIRDTYSVGLFIVRDDRVPRGYRVKTIYPNNNPTN